MRDFTLQSGDCTKSTPHWIPAEYARPSSTIPAGRELTPYYSARYAVCAQGITTNSRTQSLLCARTSPNESINTAANLAVKALRLLRRFRGLAGLYPFTSVLRTGKQTGTSKIGEMANKFWSGIGDVTRQFDQATV